MTPQKYKIELIKKGLNVSQMAREMAPTENASEKSLRDMLYDMINCRRWYPSLAERVNEKFDLNLVRPKHLATQPQRQAAA